VAKLLHLAFDFFHQLLAADSGAQKRLQHREQRLGFFESERAVRHFFYSNAIAETQQAINNRHSSRRALAPSFMSTADCFRSYFAAGLTISTSRVMVMSVAHQAGQAADSEIISVNFGGGGGAHAHTVLTHRILDRRGKSVQSSTTSFVTP